MEELPRETPPAYQTTSPKSVDTLSWPSAPRHDPSVTLPNLQSILSSDFDHESASLDVTRLSNRQDSVNSILSLPRIDPGYARKNSIATADVAMASPAETGSIMSVEDRTQRSTSVSMDDPDVRIAAEALSGLGKEFPPLTQGAHDTRPTSGARASETEPLLELVSQVHPWVGGTIKGSMSAYSTTKYYSPRIVRYSVNLIERNVGSPLAGAVGSVSAMTGIEDGLRRHLDARRTGDLEQGNQTRMDIDEQDTSAPRIGRDFNVEPLPPYGASRPPSYREEESPASMDRSVGNETRERPPVNRTWSQHTFVTVSGLSVALSTTSRRSLRFCLQLLAEQTGKVNSLTRALSMLLQNYEDTRRQLHQDPQWKIETGQRPQTPDRDSNARQVAEQIKRTCDNIWNALRNVVTVVSNYAGGALPQNAREFVRAQLLSLPARWSLVAQEQSDESETSRTARRMIDFAGQGLDMMTEVSGALEATLKSAEGWLASVGRRDLDDQPMQNGAAFEEGLPQQSREKS